jgi:hypothetical protein
MHHDLTGPFWGNVVISGLAGAITLACFTAMCWMIFRPGEHEPSHPKYSILRDDR